MSVLTLGTDIRGKRSSSSNLRIRDWGDLDGVVQSSMLCCTMVVPVDLCMVNSRSECWEDIRYLTQYWIVHCYGGYVGMDTRHPSMVSG